MAKQYNIRPSEVIFLEDEYSAFCLDEACSLIWLKLEEGEEPHFQREETSFSSLYKRIERR